MMILGNHIPTFNQRFHESKVGAGILAGGLAVALEQLYSNGNLSPHKFYSNYNKILSEVKSNPKDFLQSLDKDSHIDPSIREDFYRELKEYSPPPKPLIGVEPNPGPMVAKSRINKLLKPRKSSFPSKSGSRVRGTPSKIVGLRNSSSSARKSVMAPVAIARSTKAFASPFSKRAVQVINNRELIATVNGSVAFAISTFHVNPGNITTFPWLSTVAAQYEHYRFRALRFKFVTRAPSSATGSVILSPQYRVNEGTPSTETQVSNTQDAVEGVVWNDLDCPMDVKSMFELGARKMIRSSPAFGGDPNLYDAANFFIAVLGQADTTAIGKLWVEYSVELFVPQTALSGATFSEDTLALHRAATQTFTTTLPSNIIWDTVMAEVNSIGATCVAGAAGNIILPVGKYVFQFSGSFQDSSNETFTISLHSHLNSVDLPIVQNTGSSTAGIAGGPIVNMACCGIVNVLNSTDVFSINVTLTGVAGTLTIFANSANLIIYPA